MFIGERLHRYYYKSAIIIGVIAALFGIIGIGIIIKWIFNGIDIEAGGSIFVAIISFCYLLSAEFCIDEYKDYLVIRKFFKPTVVRINNIVHIELKEVEKKGRYPRKTLDKYYYINFVILLKDKSKMLLPYSEDGFYDYYERWCNEHGYYLHEDGFYGDLS